MPYPVARQPLGTMEVTAAFNMDSWAPIPIPHRATPNSRANVEWMENIKIENVLEISVEITSAFTPILS